MDKTALVERDMQEGKDLIEALDKTEFKVDASLWFYSSDSDEWQLLIASPFVEENGPRKSYGFIRSVLTQPSPPSGISLKNVSVLTPKASINKTSENGNHYRTWYIKYQVYTKRCKQYTNRRCLHLPHTMKLATITFHTMDKRNINM